MGPNNKTIYLAWVGLFILLLVFDGYLSSLLRNDSRSGQWFAGLGYWLGHGAVIALFLVSAFWAGRKHRRPGLVKIAKMGLAAFALAGLLSQVFKHLIGRARPRLWAEGISHWGPSLTGGFDSMPSGHTAVTMAVALVIAYQYPRTAPAAFAWASMVAAARIMGGSHFPADVLAGLALGLSVGWVVIRFFPASGSIDQPGAGSDV